MVKPSLFPQEIWILFNLCVCVCVTLLYLYLLLLSLQSLSFPPFSTALGRIFTSLTPSPLSNSLKYKKALQQWNRKSWESFCEPLMPNLVPVWVCVCLSVCVFSQNLKKKIPSCGFQMFCFCPLDDTLPSVLLSGKLVECVRWVALLNFEKA